jgi:pimeloyl-ACP methyl ester carboxylesterase
MPPIALDTVLGPKTGVPVVFLTHLAAVLDSWDPRVVDGIAAHHRVIAFDNRGVGTSTGTVPKSIEAMAADAVTFIRVLGLTKVDLLGFSMGGMIAQVIVQPSRTWSAVRREGTRSPRAIAPRYLSRSS